MRHFWGGSNTTIVNNNIYRFGGGGCGSRPMFFGGYGGGGCCGGGGNKFFNMFAGLSMLNMFSGMFSGGANRGMFGQGSFMGQGNYGGYGNYNNGYGNNNSQYGNANLSDLNNKIDTLTSRLTSLEDTLSDKNKSKEIGAGNSNGNVDGNADASSKDSKKTDVSDSDIKDVKEDGDADAAAGKDNKTGNAIDYSKIKDGMNMVCRDASGKTQNIQGEFKIVEQEKDNAVPKKFTIKDSSLGKANTYTYELTEVVDNKAIYTCIKKNDSEVKSGNVYVLEQADELLQKEGMDGYGVGLHPAK